MLGNRIHLRRLSLPLEWRPRLRQPRLQRGGFTLIELIVAMMMMAILAVTLYSSLHIAFRARDAAMDAIKGSQSADIAMNFMSTDLRNSMPPTGILAGNFEGTTGSDDRGHEADDIIFFTTADAADDASANGEIKQIELTVQTEPGTGDHTLVRLVTRNLLAQQTPTPDTEVLCRGVNSFTVTYFDGTQWTNTWDSTQEQDSAPVAVQIVLALDPASSPAGHASSTAQSQFTRIITVPCSILSSSNNLPSM
jgi:type II secretion system protein J